MKVCTKCKIEKPFEKFRKDRSKKDGYYSSCKECYIKDNPYNKDYMDKYNKKYYEQNQFVYLEKHRNDRNQNPLKWLLRNIKQRCNNPNFPKYKYYGGRGIKCLITEEELKTLWYRDKAYEMVKPSIDRKENDGNYELSNCQFIELPINTGKDKKISVIQYSKTGSHIRVWSSIKEASKETGESAFLIIKSCKKFKTFRNKFIWRYSNVD